MRFESLISSVKVRCSSLIAVLIFSVSSPASEDGYFALSDIPKLDNKKPITMVVETGLWANHLEQQMLPDFTRATGVEVNLVTMELGQMYSTQQDAMTRGLGQYDLLALEAGWAKEWAANGFTVPLLELAKQHDPEGEQGMLDYLSPFYPALLDILSYQNEYHSVPWNNYIMGNHYRADLFEHPQEQADFAEQFGYPLAPPKTLQQLKDTAHFFTRKAGDTLAGKALDQPFWGIALMGGLKPHINDEFSAMIWGKGGRWLSPLYSSQNQLHGFRIEADSDIVLEVAETYRDLLQYAHPVDENWAFRESANAFASGHVAMWPFAYNNQWPISFKVEDNIAGASIGIAPVPLGHPYTGAYSMAVAYDSKNPEAAYWLLKYIGSYKAQMAYARSGGSPCRMDVSLTLGQDSNNRHLFGALIQSHQSHLNWSGKIDSIGHFNSTAMGEIYPELMRSSYLMSQPDTDIKQLQENLQTKLKELQNRNGQVGTIEPEDVP